MFSKAKQENQIHIPNQAEDAQRRTHKDFWVLAQLQWFFEKLAYFFFSSTEGQVCVSKSETKYMHVILFF